MLHHLPVHLVTDSSAQFVPADIVRQHQIRVLPLGIRVGEHLYSEPDLDLIKLQGMSHREKALPILEVPSPEQIAEFYQQVSYDGRPVVAIHMSSELSPLVKNARQAADWLGSRPNVKVIDSREIGVTLACLVTEVANLLMTNTPIHEFDRLIRGLAKHTYSIYLTESLEALNRQKILRPSQAILGEMLKIKPVLSMESGRMIAIEKTRTRAQGLEKLVEFSSEFDEMQQLVFLHPQTNLSNELRYVSERLNNALVGKKRKWPTQHYLPSLATFIGCEAVGVAIFEGASDERSGKTYHFSSVD
jgi:DegV family protein with EDD domain